MSTASRPDAQRRIDDVHAFRRELGRLEAEHGPLLDPERRRAVEAHHERLVEELARAFDVDPDERAKQLSLGMRVASLIGALALAASVYFLFYQIWGWLSPAVQVTALLGAALASFGATIWLQARGVAEYFVKLAAMVAFACFVLNVAMLGQIFNLTPTERVFLPWAGLAFVLAYACDLRLLLAAGILCVTGYIAARCGTWSGLYWLSFGQRPENFFPAALALLAVPSWVPHRGRPGFLPVYRVLGLLILLLPMLVLAHHGRASYLVVDESQVEGGYQVLGFAVSAAAVWWGIRRGWAHVVNTATAFFVVLLYTKLYDWWWEIMPKSLFFLLIALGAILAILVMRRMRAYVSAVRDR